MMKNDENEIGTWHRFRVFLYLRKRPLFLDLLGICLIFFNSFYYLNFFLIIFFKDWKIQSQNSKFQK